MTRIEWLVFLAYLPAVFAVCGLLDRMEARRRRRGGWR